MWEIPLTALILVLGFLAHAFIKMKEAELLAYVSNNRACLNTIELLKAELRETQDEVKKMQQRIDMLSLRSGFKG